MSNYVNNISIHGLMNRFAFLNDKYPLSYYKVKNKSKVVICKDKISEEEEKKYKYISYMYLDNDPGIKGAYFKNNVLSIIDSGFFNGMPGNKYRHIRHAVNCWKDKISIGILSKENLDDVLEMIEKWKWDENGGYKYHWQEHAGIDKTLVNKICNKEVDDILGLVFYYNDECVAYSTISIIPNIVDDIPEFHYVTRKVRIKKDLKHLTEFVDWKTFSIIYWMFCEKDFIINWGASDGGVYWYKTHKWPLYKLEPTWFVSFYPNGK
ncbi:MAG: hypothetical protein J1F35_08805 [Erysipelotrichales bacterium]|nr:hypothetical protein [Erysipelotrichales bacterium]